MKRTATAVWNGSGKDGKGNLTTQSTTLSKAQYSYKTRFEDGVGTNPEELIAAAHAGCFAMALAFGLQGAGITPDSLEVTATVTLDVSSGTPTITESHLDLKAKIPGITNEKFQEFAKGAEQGCPVSRVLKAQVSLTATLA
ncbi:MAG TPA: OsmC family protein [Puia sp.]|nr:OsmC family protein [Puia sp.]